MGIMDKKMETAIMGYMAGCQNYGPFLGTLNVRCRVIIAIQKRIILTTTHIGFRAYASVHIKFSKKLI